MKPTPTGLTKQGRRALLAMGCCLLGTPWLLGADYTSYTEPSRNIEIAAPEPGVVQEVIGKEGQQVKAGDIIVKLDARVIERDAEVAAEELRFKEDRLSKLQDLLKKNFASTQEVERAENDRNITALKLKRAQAMIERLTLRSPIDGIITEVRYDVSESVSGQNSHVATVVQLSPMKVQFNLPTEIARKLKVGDTVDLQFPESNSTRKAKVEFVSPVSTAVVNTVRVTMSISEQGTPLMAGMKCVYSAPDQPETTEPASKP